MRRPGFVYIVSLLLSMTGLSQTAPPQSKPAGGTPSASADARLPSDAPTRDQVMTLLDTMEIRKTLKLAIENMQQIVRQAAEETFKQRVPAATPKQLEDLRGTVDAALLTLSQQEQDELINVYVQIYQRHLTKTDIEEMIRFYSSPVGQKLLRELPQIMQ